jgi:hypothetical protein
MFPQVKFPNSIKQNGSRLSDPERKEWALARCGPALGASWGVCRYR